MNPKSITMDVSEVGSRRAYLRQGTSRRESIDRPTLPPNFSLTLTIFYCLILEILLRKHRQSMFPIVTRSCSAYKWEVDYKGLNEAITSTIYHRSGLQGASMSSQKPKQHSYTNYYHFNPRATSIKALKRVMILMNNINTILT